MKGTKRTQCNPRMQCALDGGVTIYDPLGDVSCRLYCPESRASSFDDMSCVEASSNLVKSLLPPPSASISRSASPSIVSPSCFGGVVLSDIFIP